MFNQHFGPCSTEVVEWSGAAGLSHYLGSLNQECTLVGRELAQRTGKQLPPDLTLKTIRTARCSSIGGSTELVGATAQCFSASMVRNPPVADCDKECAFANCVRTGILAARSLFLWAHAVGGRDDGLAWIQDGLTSGQ